MIKKERKIPLKIQKLEALLRRLPSNHSKRKKIEDELAKSLAGYRGEQSLEYYLSFLPDKKFHIFHDIRLPDSEGRFFQIDVLVLSTCFFLIIEVKNISGTLIFDPSFHQLIRTMNGKEEAFLDPVLQIRRQQLQFESWLAERKIPSIPIIPLIVISNPSTIIKTSSHQTEIQQKVIHAVTLPTKVEMLDSLNTKEILTSKEVGKISRLLLKENSPYQPDVLQQFQILNTELNTGVHCPHCFFLPMRRVRGKWLCPQCGFTSKDAYIPSLFDYSLLLGTSITNRQLRDFLQLSSISVTTKLLGSLNLEFSGALKGRKYELPLPD